jgi:hypothetical protein
LGSARSHTERGRAIDAGYQETAIQLLDGFDERELHSFVAAMGRVLERTRDGRPTAERSVR